MSLTCEACGVELLDIDVKCPDCGKPQMTTGAHRMLGSVVLGHYEIVDVLGQGGMSVVYQGRHLLTDQEVALKILPRELAAHTQVKSRFVEEAKALAQLDHPHIVHLYNFGEDNGCFILAMQYIAGRTFERIILEAGELDWVVASQVAIDVLEALEYAHGRGVIHRDMKPSNVLVRDDDGSATVMDFGIAKMTNSTRLTATGQTMGTVRYMSPEQVRGHEVDARTDIYSLGATLYEAICGDTPFDGETYFEIMNKHLHELPLLPSAQGIAVPPALERALLCALAKKPEDRFQSARELRKELEAMARGAGAGHPESLRMTREALARSPATRTDDATARATPAGRPGATRDAAVVTAGPVAVASPTLTLARSGSRSGPAAGDSAPDPDSLVLGPPVAELAAPRSRPVLWLALAGAAVLASGVAVFALGRTHAPARATAAAGGQTVELAAFLPPRVTFAVTRAFDRDALRVLAPETWDADRVVAVYRGAHDRFVELMRERDPASEVPRLPLTVAIVPQWVLCDERVYETRKVPQDCEGLGVTYRPREQTVLIAARREEFDDNLAYGVALARCLQTSLPGCEEVVDRVDADIHERRRKAGRGERGEAGRASRGEPE